MKNRYLKRTAMTVAMIVLATLTVVGRTARVASAAPPGAATRPNILFIFSDDHSIQTIGAYGTRLSEFCKQHAVTPHIDRLAEQGALFQNSFCGNSLCSPSRASVLTGLHSHANGVMTLNVPLKPGLPAGSTSST